MNKYGQIIRQKRKEKYMTQEDLAKRLGVTASAISGWEVGRNEPNMGMVLKMAEIFGCKVSEMMGKKEDNVKFVVDIESKADLEIIQKIGNLDHEDKLKILGRIEAMLESEKYR